MYNLPSLFSRTFQPRRARQDGPALDLLKAVREGRVGTWTRRWPAFPQTPPDAQTSRHLRGAVALMVERKDIDGLCAIAEHPVLASMAGEPVVWRALTAHDPSLDRIARSMAVLRDAPAFQVALHALLEAPPKRPGMEAIAAHHLGALADTAIIKNRWTPYAWALAQATQAGYIGVIPWAHLHGLPVIGCLPLMERLTTIYATQTPEAAFRLASLVAQAGRESAHQKVRLRHLLSLAGNHPAQVLFRPHPQFHEACLRLAT